MRICSPGILLSFLALPLLAQSPTGIDLGAIDRAAQPCNNFYQYACGTWMRNNPIPPDQDRWGRFDELGQRTRLTLRGILEKSPDEKIGMQYASCMDEKTVEAKGIGPIRDELERIDKLAGRQAFAAEIAHLHSSGVAALFRFSSAPDAKDATREIAQLGQGGLTLPDRDYYLKTDPKSEGIRTKYLAHLQKMLELAGRDPKDAPAILAIETALAKASSDRVAMRDPQKRYNRKSLAELSALAPDFDWNTYLHAVQVHIENLNVSSPDFAKGMNDVLRSDLRPYLAWQVIHGAASRLPAAFVQENFEFTGKTLSGAPAMPPRWKMCVQLVDRQMGEALGRKYVEQTFGKAGKERTLQMVGEIEAEMAKDIQSLAWMSDATKQQSLAKLRIPGHVDNDSGDVNTDSGVM